MAIRLLLTLLALVVGLAAQFTPAQARSGVAVDVEIGATLCEAAVQRQSLVRSPRSGLIRYRNRAEVSAIGLAMLPPEVVAVPVLIGIDRARE